jgi:hypothetical protein
MAAPGDGSQALIGYLRGKVAIAEIDETGKAECVWIDEDVLRARVEWSGTAATSMTSSPRRARSGTGVGF